MSNRLLNQNNKANLVVKILTLVRSMCLLTSCQAVTQRRAGELSFFKEAVQQDIDRGTLFFLERNLACLEFQKAIEKATSIRSPEEKHDAYVHIAHRIQEVPGQFEKHRTEFREVIVKIEENIPILSKGCDKLSAQITVARFMYEDGREEALDLMNSIMNELEECDVETQAKLLTRICVQQAETFNNLELSKKAAEAAETAILQINDPNLRAELCANLLDSKFSIFKDGEAGSKMVRYIEKTMSYIDSLVDRREGRERLHEIKRKHNLYWSPPELNFYVPKEAVRSHK